MSAKAKGSRYERELVALVDELGLPAHRVPLSGAMQGYKDDVVIADTWRVECKYRRDGTGFKRLHDWMDAAPECLHLVKSGLLVFRLDDWCRLARSTIDGMGVVYSLTESNASEQKTLLKWKGGADVLALRRAHYGWLMCIDANQTEEE